MFNILEYQEMIRQSDSPRELYLMTETLAQKRQRGEVSVLARQECIDPIKERIRGLEEAKAQLKAAATLTVSG